MLLDRVLDYLFAANLLDGWSVKQDEFDDVANTGQNTFVVRTSGPAGLYDIYVQNTAVRMILVVENPRDIAISKRRMQTIIDHIKINYSAPGLVELRVTSPLSSPVKMADGRRILEFTVKCTTDDL